MKILLFTIIFFTLFLVLFIDSCSEDKKQIKFYLLSPFTASGMMINPRNDNKSLNDTLNYKTFIIEGDYKKDTTSIKKIIFDFIDTSQKNFVTKNTHCVIDFYKTSSNLNKDFKETHNDMLGGYSDDRLAQLEWVNGKLNLILLYKKSKLMN